MKTKVLVFAIALIAASTQGQLTITTSSPLPAGTVGHSYNQAFNANGGTVPYTWSVSAGTYTPGLFQSDIPTIDGTPTTAGTYSFTIKVVDHANQSTTKVFSMTINPQPLPSVQTTAASSIGVNSATLNSTVNPNGATTTIYYQYGLTTSYGSTSSSQNIGTASGSYGISVSSLSANTTYHFRVVASNSGGTTNGNDLTFTTLPQPVPTVQTLAAGAITANSATLNFSVNPNGASTTVYFQYGLTTSYGSTSFSLTGITSSGSYGIGISGLSANQTYHFRAVASNSGGTTYGNDLTFSTSIPQLSVSPSGNLTASGDHGGPFSPASQQYSLSNVGTGTLNWIAGADQNWVSVSSSSGSGSGNVTVSINSNANSLSAGTYSSTVTFDGNGGSITRQVQLTVTNAPVSASKSSLAAVPPSASADGASQIVATATLNDIYGNPVSGKTIQFNSTGPASIIRPGSPTDVYGNASATITANTPGTVTITAKDMTDNVAVQQPVTITFTQQTLVAPNASFSNAIVTLYQDSASALNGGVHSISATATNAGALGETFNLTADKAAIILDVAFGVAGAIQTIPDQNEAASLLAKPGYFALSDIKGTPMLSDAQISYLLDNDLLDQVSGNQILLGAFNYIIQEYGQEKIIDAGTDFYISSLNNIAADPNSPIELGNDAVASCNSAQQALQQQEQNLLNSGVPASLNQSTWTTDLLLRSRVGPTFQAVLIQQDQFLQQAAAAKLQSTQQWNSWFAVRFGLTVAAGLMGDGPGSLLVGGIFTIASEYNDGRNLSSDQISYFSAISLLSGCFQYAGQTYLNTANAHGEISGNLASDPVTAQIGPMSDVENGYTAVGLFGLQSVFSATNANSSIIITNTSSESATFEVFVLSSYSGSAYGVQIANLSQVSFTAATILPGANMAIPILYYDGAHGGIPDSGPAFPMVVYVLGNNQSGTFYIGGFSHNWSPTYYTSGSVWQPLVVHAAQNSPLKPLDGGGSSSNSVAEIENPVSTYVIQNPTNQTYQAEIFVVNPFGQSCTAIVTQALPSGINVLTTDGASGASAIVWTNNISTNLVEDTFTFTISVVPGAQTNLPPPTVTFVDQTNNQSSPFNSTTPGFNGLFPVQVSGSIPAAVWGTNSPMLIAVTNLTSTGQSGYLTVTLTDSSGNPVTNLLQTFFVSGSGGTNLNFTLPGSLSAGTYTLTGSLNINGGTGQVLVGNYVVPRQPITLIVDLPPIDSNGFFHLKFNGPPGSNYVVMATSNLASPTNWQAIAFYSPTNMPASISVPMLTNASQMFYWIMMQ